MPVSSDHQVSDEKSEKPEVITEKTVKTEEKTGAVERKIAIAVDLSDESAHAVRWAVENYLRPGDRVTILHVRPTSVLYGADWGSCEASALPPLPSSSSPSQGGERERERARLEDEFSAFTEAKSSQLAAPLIEAGIPYNIKIVKDHDMKERLCLEVERLRVSACIMGSRGFGAEKRSRRARLGSVSDYCVHHCDCPVVVVRMPDEKDEKTLDLTPVPEETNPV